MYPDPPDTLTQAHTRSPPCTPRLWATQPLRASCRRQAEAPVALEPSWCQHCHRVAAGARCTGRKAGRLAGGAGTGEAQHRSLAPKPGPLRLDEPNCHFGHFPVKPDMVLENWGQIVWQLEPATAGPGLLPLLGLCL